MMLTIDVFLNKIRLSINFDCSAATGSAEAPAVSMGGVYAGGRRT
jgi:hypothetical protein